jgi:hypothetical protein
MYCKSCRGLDPRGYAEGFLVNLSDLQDSCRFCLLLRSLTLRFAPHKGSDLVKPFLRIDRQEGHVVTVELAAEDAANGPGSLETSANFYLYNPSRR